MHPPVFQKAPAAGDALFRRLQFFTHDHFLNLRPFPLFQRLQPYSPR